MQAPKARVENGRLGLDEPTYLPDGAELEVVVINDRLSPEERAELHAGLDRALTWTIPKQNEAWTFGSTSSSIELAAKTVLLAATPAAPQPPNRIPKRRENGYSGGSRGVSYHRRNPPPRDHSRRNGDS
jgi:hypothetical protein